MSTAAQPVSGPIADLDARRRGQTSLTTSEPGRLLDLGEMSDDDFTQAMQAMERRTVRVKRIMEHFLVKDTHYGNPKDSKGRKAFKKPILLQAGAQHLRGIFGLTPVHMSEPEVISTPEFSSVRVTIALRDRNGRLSAPRTGACTSHEKRFHRFDGKGYTWRDAREVLHDLYAMSEKRAAGLATIETLGLAGHFDNEDEGGNKRDDRVLVKWTKAEKSRVVDAAKAKGIVTRAVFDELVMKTLGRDQVGSGEDVEKLLAAIAKWTPDGTPPNGDANARDPNAAASTPAPTEPAAPADAARAAAANDGRPTAETPLTFGPHKAKLIKDVPGEYLAELSQQPKKLPEIWRKVVFDEIDRREGNDAASSGNVPESKPNGTTKAPF